MSKKQLVTVLVIIAVVIIVSVSVVWSARELQRMPANRLPSNVEENADQSVPDIRAKASTYLKVVTSDVDTSDWKTYRNEEFSFSFKYPPEWRVLVFRKGELVVDPQYGIGREGFEHNQSPLYVEVKGETKSDYKLFYIIDETNFNLLEKLHNDDPDAWVVEPIVVSGMETKKYIRVRDAFQIRVPFQIGVYRHDLSWHYEGTSDEETQQLLNAFLLNLRIL